ncbi:MAG: ABC transporter permease [Caldilineaceae bacterium]
MVLPCSALALAGLGAYIGVASRTLEESSTYSQVILFLFMILGPVLIPPQNLPAVMRAAGWLSPATYGASALRQTLLGPVTPLLLIDLLALSCFCDWLYAAGGSQDGLAGAMGDCMINRLRRLHRLGL